MAVLRLYFQNMVFFLHWDTLYLWIALFRPTSFLSLDTNFTLCVTTIVSYPYCLSFTFILGPEYFLFILSFVWNLMLPFLRVWKRSQCCKPFLFIFLKCLLIYLTNINVINILLMKMLFSHFILDHMYLAHVIFACLLAAAPALHPHGNNGIIKVSHYLMRVRHAVFCFSSLKARLLLWWDWLRSGALHFLWTAVGGFMIRQMYYHLTFNSFMCKGGKINPFSLSFSQQGQIYFMISLLKG